MQYCLAGQTLIIEIIHPAVKQVNKPAQIGAVILCQLGSFMLILDFCHFLIVLCSETFTIPDHPSTTRTSHRELFLAVIYRLPHKTAPLEIHLSDLEINSKNPKINITKSL